MATAFLRFYLIGALIVVMVACAPRKPTASTPPQGELIREQAALPTQPPPVVVEKALEVVQPTPAPFEGGRGGEGIGG
ncbi:MAG: hypothetical protein N2383_06135, partial [Caldilineales bacterium]|nr:hypothetical protein [Caldilineales bacterium]